LSDYLIHNNKHILEMIYKGMANRCGLGKVRDGTGEEIIATSEDTTAGDKKMRALRCRARDACTEEPPVSEDR
jgi:hypothetical protein